MRNLLLTLGVLLFGASMALAAGPMPDELFVHFNDPVVVSQNITLPPGNYKFQRITKPTDPAIFTIMNADTHQVLGNTPSAELAQNGPDADLAKKGGVLLDRVNGKDYLDTLYLQSVGTAFMFEQPTDARQEAVANGTRIRVPGNTGGQE